MNNFKSLSCGTKRGGGKTCIGKRTKKVGGKQHHFSGAALATSLTVCSLWHFKVFWMWMKIWMNFHRVKLFARKIQATSGFLLSALFEMEPTSCFTEDFNWNDAQFRHFAPYSHLVTHTRIQSHRPTIGPGWHTQDDKANLLLSYQNSDSAGNTYGAALYLPTCSITQMRRF